MSETASTDASLSDQEASAMKKLWIICTVAVSLATGFALAAMAEDQNVAGTWTGTATKLTLNHGGWITHDFTLVLKQDGQAVTGSWSLKRGGRGTRAGRTTEGRAEGTLVGDNLSLKIGSQRWLEATVIGDSMSGKTGSGGNLPFDVRGARAKDAQSPRGNQDVQSPRGNQNLQSPRGNQNVQSPRGN